MHVWKQFNNSTFILVQMRILKLANKAFGLFKPVFSAIAICCVCGSDAFFKMFTVQAHG